jgi:hypothetical protein
MLQHVIHDHHVISGIFWKVRGGGVKHGKVEPATDVVTDEFGQIATHHIDAPTMRILQE